MAEKNFVGKVMTKKQIDRIETVEEMFDRYPDEWIYFEVLEEDEYERPSKGVLVAHHSDRDGLHELIMQNRVTRGAAFYTGPIVPEGHEVLPWLITPSPVKRLDRVAKITQIGRKSMGTGIQGLLDTVAELKEKADVNAIFGEPVTVHDRTIIPVAKVGYGFGVGFGYDSTPGDDENEDEGENEPEATEQMGGGSGGGVQARPFAVIEVTPDSVRVEAIVDEQKLALGGLLLAAWGTFWTACTLIAIFAARATVRISEKD